MRAPLLLLACAATGLSVLPGANPPAPAPPAGLWLDLVDGEETTEAAVVDDLAGAGVIFIGEAHTIARHHAIPLRLFTALAERGLPLVLCLEQLEARNQPDVDRFNRGELDFAGLAAAIGWAREWRNYTDYRPFLEVARAHQIPVRALNAPAEVIHAVSRGGGLAKLDPAQRANLPAEIVTDDPVYERQMNLQLAVHAAMDPARLHTVFEAQVARDETMAANIVVARHQGAPVDEPRTAFVIVGAGHVRYGLGTAARVARRDPGIAERIVLMTESGQLQLSAAEQAAARAITITHAQLRETGRPPGDYLHVLPLAEAGGPP